MNLTFHRTNAQHPSSLFSSCDDWTDDWAEVKDNAVIAGATTQHFKTPNAVAYTIESRFPITETAYSREPKVSSYS